MQVFKKNTHLWHYRTRLIYITLSYDVYFMNKQFNRRQFHLESRKKKLDFNLIKYSDSYITQLVTSKVLSLQ